MSETATERELTYGEKAVGITFNPSGNSDVDDIKQHAAAIINILDRNRKKVINPSEKGAVLTHAIREVMGAQMWAVKGVTLPDENLEQK